MGLSLRGQADRDFDRMDRAVSRTRGLEGALFVSILDPRLLRLLQKLALVRVCQPVGQLAEGRFQLRVDALIGPMIALVEVVRRARTRQVAAILGCLRGSGRRFAQRGREHEEQAKPTATSSAANAPGSVTPRSRLRPGRPPGS